MKPCNITSRSLIISWLTESNKTRAQIKSVQYFVSACFLAVHQLLTFWYIKSIKRSKEKNAIMLQLTLIEARSGHDH